MKKIINFFISLFVLCSLSLQAQPPNNNPAYKLVWADSFNIAVNHQIDTSKWSQRYDWYAWDTLFLNTCDSQYYDIGYRKWYVPDGTYPLIPASYPTDTTNSKVYSGILNLYTHKESYSAMCLKDASCPTSPDSCNVSLCLGGSCKHSQYRGFKYTTGMLISKYKFRYGYFEIKFKIPNCTTLTGSQKYSSGPNFWMFTGASNGVDYGEIDVFEMNGRTGQYTNNLLYRLNDSDAFKSDYYSRPTNITDTLWHTGGCLWTPNEISYYLDSTFLRSVPNYQNGIRTDSMQAMRLVVDINSPATNFCETFDPVNTMDYRYQVDYVKVWQIKDTCGTDQSFCSSLNPATYDSKLYQSITLEGGSCIDSLNNVNFLGLYGSNYVLMDAGFSIDNNSKVEIDTEHCLYNNNMHYVGIPAPQPPPQGYQILHQQ